MKIKPSGIVTLTTDFGLIGPYVGAMKGAILSVNPSAVIVDVTHMVTPQNIAEAAVTLSEAYASFPPGTIHMAIVDPGVGGKRKAVAIETDEHLFVGPDNGVFSAVLADKKPRGVFHITARKYLAKKISPTFHGRDVFAPAAAHLSLGLKPVLLGKKLSGMTKLDMPACRKSGNAITGSVLYADSFGNLITNIPASLIKPRAGVSVCIKGTVIAGLLTTYSDAKKGALMTLSSSSGRLEIAVNGASAAAALGASPGEPVMVRLPATE